LSDGIQFTKKDSSDKVIIPHGIDLSNIGTCLTIEDIKTINPLLGIDEYYTLDDSDTIPFAKNEKFFQYYKKVYEGDLIDFGVLVRAYTDIGTINLFNIDKRNNLIYIGCNQMSVISGTRIRGNLYIQI
jgi:hypothetical protein